jgi:hypothetical protein
MPLVNVILKTELCSRNWKFYDPVVYVTVWLKTLNKLDTRNRLLENTRCPY